MWKDIKKETPEVDDKHFDSSDLSLSSCYYYKSKPIIIYARQEDNWAPNVFYIGYWVEEVTNYKVKPKYRAVVRYFKEYNQNLKRAGSIIEKGDIDYWDYYNGDLPEFIKEE